LGTEEEDKISTGRLTWKDPSFLNARQPKGKVSMKRSSREGRAVLSELNTANETSGKKVLEEKKSSRMMSGNLP